MEQKSEKNSNIYRSILFYKAVWRGREKMVYSQSKATGLKVVANNTEWRKEIWIQKLNLETFKYKCKRVKISDGIYVKKMTETKLSL